MERAEQKRIMRKVMSDMLKRAKSDVEKARKAVLRTETKMQIALDNRNAADEALNEARYKLSLVERDQENWRKFNQ